MKNKLLMVWSLLVVGCGTTIIQQPIPITPQPVSDKRDAEKDNVDTKKKDATKVAVNYIHANNEEVIRTLEEIKRNTAEESPTAPLVDNALWIATERQRPWTTAVREQQGAVVVDVPRKKTEDKKMVKEAFALTDLIGRDYGPQPDPYIPPEFAETMVLEETSHPWQIALAVTAAFVLAIILYLLIRSVQKMRTWKSRARKLYMIGNKIKEISPEVKKQFVDMTQDLEVAEGYEESKAIALGERRQNQKLILTTFGASTQE